MIAEPRTTTGLSAEEDAQEEALLGALIAGIPQHLVGEALEIVVPEDMRSERRVRILAAILAVYVDGVVPDPVVVMKRLRDDGALDVLGNDGPLYLASLASEVPIPANVVHYACLVADVARRQRSIEQLDDTRRRIVAGEDPDAMFAALQVPQPAALRAATLDGVRVTNLADVVMQRARFAWTERIPLGSLTLVAGVPGQGKTTLMVHIGARITRGQLDGDLHGVPADVLIASAEDALSFTLKPRFVAAGADLARVHSLSVHRDDTDLGITIPDDLREIAATIERTDARLLVIDPLLAHIPARIDGYKDQHVRIALAPLARLAEDLGIAVVGVMHLNKREATDLFSRLGGSGGFLAACRSALLVAPDPQDEAERVVAHGKYNLTQQAPSLRFRLEQHDLPNPDPEDVEPIRVGAVAMLGESDLTVGNLLASTQAPPRGDALAWLAQALAAGPMPVDWLKAEAEQRGIAWRTVQRAKRDLGVSSGREGFGEGGRWTWMLP